MGECLPCMLRDLNSISKMMEGQGSDSVPFGLYFIRPLSVKPASHAAPALSPAEYNTAYIGKLPCAVKAYRESGSGLRAPPSICPEASSKAFCWGRCSGPRPIVKERGETRPSSKHMESLQQKFLVFSLWYKAPYGNKKLEVIHGEKDLSQKLWLAASWRLPQPVSPGCYKPQLEDTACLLSLLGCTSHLCWMLQEPHWVRLCRLAAASFCPRFANCSFTFACSVNPFIHQRSRTMWSTLCGSVQWLAGAPV